MNVFIFIVFCFLGLYSSTRILSSNDVSNLIVKHTRSELTDDESKVIEEVAQVFTRIWGGSRTITKGMKCFGCRSAFTALYTLIKIGISDERIISTSTKLCSMIVPANVCRGVIKLNYPILKYIIKTTPKATRKTFCGILLQSYQDLATCVYNDPRFLWNIELPPKPQIQRNHQVHDNQKPLTIAVLSDLHVDPFYEPFGIADCDEPICCRKGQNQRSKEKSLLPEDEIVLRRSFVEYEDEIILDIDAASRIYKKNNTNDTKKQISNIVSEPAGFWGDYRNCDTPTLAFKDVLDRIASHKEVDVVYYLGDNIDHHIWETTYEHNGDVNSLIVETMKEVFRSHVIVVPTIGNHESQPLNQFAPIYVEGEGLNTTWLYKSLANKWSYYLTKKAAHSMRQRGGFSMLIRPGLRVISINNNVAYKYNWWLLYDPLNLQRQLDWLVNELLKAELSGEKVHILSHIPPGDVDLIYIWTREYHKIVDRFSSTITAQFNGHYHTDEFKIFYKDGKAVNVAWGAGAATTYQNLNMNYKIVTFDNSKFEPTNIVNYIYNLTEANLTPHQRPRWYELYDIKTSFQLQNLSAAAMDQLVHGMVMDEKHLLDMYVTFSSKASDAMPHCDTRCKLEVLCNAVTSVLWHRDMCDELTHLYFLTD